jgi:hypothetical protein
VGLSFVLALALAQNASAVAAGGGTMTTYDAGGTNYTVHTFTNSGTFDVISPGNVDVLVVAGGGGGGQIGGGGGAGGLIYSNAFAVTAGSNYTVTIGGGGAGAQARTAYGGKGTNSVFGPITATGGGGGGSYNSAASRNGQDGGSGGGGAYTQTSNQPGGTNGYANPPGQGNNGGSTANSTNGNLVCAGGGGSGQVGMSILTTNVSIGGDGGTGLVYDISGIATNYAGGGGGYGDTVRGMGGAGGGGRSATNNPGNGFNGTANTGGGGGGGRGNGGPPGFGGNGGSGIVIVRYVTPAGVPPTLVNLAATNVTTSSAWMNGSISSTGGAPVTAVSVYWGAINGGDPTSGLWTHTNTVTGDSSIWTNGAQVTSQASPLTENTTYYYRFAASNAVGLAGAPTTRHFLAGNVTVTNTDASAVWQWPNPDTGILTIQRDPLATNADLAVSYAWGGTAVQGVDYTASPAGTNIALPAGVASTNITIVPLRHSGSPGTTVWLTLLPGEYAVGTPSSNNVEIGASTFDGVWKVVPGGAGVQNGVDWANAFATISNGVAAAIDGDTILVSNGTYVLSTEISVTKAVTIRSLNGPTNTTISGNNAVRIFNISTGVTNWWIDGFTMQNGKASGVGGGAMLIVGAGITGLVSNCIITNNGAGANKVGGGIAAGGGAVTTYRNCLIAYNTAAIHAAGIAGRSYTGKHTIENCTFYGNTVTNTSAAWMGGSSFGGETPASGNSVTNSIFGPFSTDPAIQPLCVTSGVTIAYSMNAVTNAPFGIGNKTGDPVFVSIAAGNFQLQPSSPCINTGATLSWMATATDLAGQPRLYGPADMGAYELQRPKGSVIIIR